MYNLSNIPLTPKKWHKKTVCDTHSQTVLHKGYDVYAVSSSVSFSLLSEGFFRTGVMLFAQIAIVEALCRNADVVGAITPNKPSSSRDELKAMINR